MLKNNPAQKEKKYERNPRHKIVVTIGTGNEYCTSCPKLTPSGNLSVPMCEQFRKTLEVKYRGPARCDDCRQAEKDLLEIKNLSRKEGSDVAFFRANSDRM